MPVTARSVVLYVFSGTGNTQYVADLVARRLADDGHRVVQRRIDRALLSAPELDPHPGSFDIVGLAYPVHAWNAPRLVFELIDRLPLLGGSPAFVLRTAGDPLLNGGATTPVREALLARGYGAFRDDLIIMPANMLLRYDERLVKQLLRKAESVAARAARGIAALEVSLPRESPAVIAAARLFGAGETRGARRLGRRIRVSAACDGCGRCARECPTGNIALEGVSPRFGDDCVLCLHCFCACARGALTPIVGRRLLVSPWYDLRAIAQDDAIPADLLNPGTRGFFRRFWRYIQSP